MDSPNSLTGQYVGIVIDDKDPLYSGRVQVFIPALDYQLTGSLSGSTNYIFPGNDNDGSLTIREIKLLRKSCVWAYVQQPIFGGSTMGRVDMTTGKTTVSDGATNTNQFQFSDCNYGALTYASKFASYGSRVDPFINPTDYQCRKSNYTGKDYFPVNYANAPKGMFCTPGVGAKVLVSFLGGSKTQAIITGKLPFARENKIML